MASKRWDLERVLMVAMWIAIIVFVSLYVWGAVDQAGRQ